MKSLPPGFSPLRPLFLAALTVAAAAEITASSAHAQVQTGGPWKITSSTIDGGGGKSTGGPWTLTGTSGQPDASPATATSATGSFAVQGGFWGDAAVVPSTDGGPDLTLTLLNASSVQLSWPAEAAGFTLQYSNDLTHWTFLKDITAAGSSPWALSQGPRFFFRLVKH